MISTSDIVAKLWNLCHVLGDDGITYHEYVTELTFLLFLKMMQKGGGVGTDGARVPAQLRDEAAAVAQQRAMQVGLRVIARKAQEFEAECVLESLDGVRVDMCLRC